MPKIFCVLVLSDDDIYDFDYSIYEDTFLIADLLSFDNSPVVSVEVNYILEGAGVVEVEEITEGSL